MECLINDLSVYYEEYGNGKPVLCIHGYTLDHKSMVGCLEPVFRNLDGYRRIYLDLPGMGRTPSREWIKNADVMLDVILKFIGNVIGEENFLISGNSYGGYLALGLALDSSLKLDGIFLFGTCVIAESSKRKLPIKNNVVVEKELELLAKDEGDFAGFIDVAAVATLKTWHRYTDEILPGIKLADTSFLEYYRNNYGLTSSEFSKLNFEKPVCVLAGNQDNSVGFEDTWDMLKHLPRLTFVLLENTGHNLQIENPEAFNLHLNDWLVSCK